MMAWLFFSFLVLGWSLSYNKWFSNTELGIDTIIMMTIAGPVTIIFGIFILTFTGIQYILST